MESAKNDGQKLPTLTPKRQDGSQRVIKQIMVIDPNKLRVAGLDLKMAEALKKTKVTAAMSSPIISSKNEKLALAKSILNNKLKKNQGSKDSIARIIPREIVKVASCNPLMPPPNTPVCMSPSNSYTVLLNFLKRDQKAGAIQMNVQNLSRPDTKRKSQTNNEVNQIPKASLKTPPVIKKSKVLAFESKIISSEMKFEMKKRPIEPEVVKSPPTQPPVEKKVILQHQPALKPQAKVIENKVLSPDEKIDLSTLCVKSPTQFVSTKAPLPTRRLAHEVMTPSKEIVPAPEQTNIPLPTTPPPPPIKEELNESAVDFISNLLMMDPLCNGSVREETAQQPEVKQEEEDATSFLITIFEQQERSRCKTPSHREKERKGDRPDYSRLSPDTDDISFTPAKVCDPRQSPPPACQKDILENEIPDIPCLESYKSNADWFADLGSSRMETARYITARLKNSADEDKEGVADNQAIADEIELLQNARIKICDSNESIESMMANPCPVEEVAVSGLAEPSNDVEQVSQQPTILMPSDNKANEIVKEPAPAEMKPPLEEAAPSDTIATSSPAKQAKPTETNIEDEIKSPTESSVQHHSTTEACSENSKSVTELVAVAESNQKAKSHPTTRRMSKKPVPALIAKLNKTRKPAPKPASQKITQDSVATDQTPTSPAKSSQKTKKINEKPPIALPKSSKKQDAAQPSPPAKRVKHSAIEPSKKVKENQKTNEESTVSVSPNAQSESVKENLSSVVDDPVGEPAPVVTESIESRTGESKEIEKPIDSEIAKQEPPTMPSPTKVLRSKKRTKSIECHEKSPSAEPAKRRASKTTRVRKVSTKSESVSNDEPGVKATPEVKKSITESSNPASLAPESPKCSKDPSEVRKSSAKPEDEPKNPEQPLPTITDYIASITIREHQQTETTTENITTRSPKPTQSVKEPQSKRIRFPKGKINLIQKKKSTASKSASKTAPETPEKSKNAFSSVELLISDDSNDFADRDTMTSPASHPNTFENQDDGNKVEMFTIKMEPDYNHESIFLGFNETEIAEGQKSTSFRLTQSEDITTGKKPKTLPVKKSPLGRGKKQKIDLVSQKTSKTSLENWLTVESKGRGRDEAALKNVVITGTSITPKKRGKKEGKANAKVSETARPVLPAGETKHHSSIIKIPTSMTQIVVATKTEREESTGPILQEPFITFEEYTIYEPQPPITPLKKNHVPSHNPKAIGTEKTPATKKKPANGKQKKPIGDTRTSADKSHSLGNLDGPKKRNPSGIHNTFYSEIYINTPKAPNQEVATLKKPPNLSYNYTPRSPIDPLQRKFKNDSEFNPRLLLIKKREELKSNQPLLDLDLQIVPKDENDVQCALCMGYAPADKWLQHISTHYGIGWIVGTPPPLNVKSRSSILNYMTDFFKTSKVKALNCRLCQAQRRSGLGLLLHLEQCCLTPEELRETRVICEHCKNEYSKTTIINHARSCSVVFRKGIGDGVHQDKDKEPVEGALSNTGRAKRKSVIRAETKLKNLDTEFVPEDIIRYIPPTIADPSAWIRDIQMFGKGFCVQKRCSFTATSVEELTDHYQKDVCPFFPKPGYQCMKCRFQSIEIDTVQEHIFEKHQPKTRKEIEDKEAKYVPDCLSEAMSSDSEPSGSDTFTEDVKSVKKKKSKTPKGKRSRDIMLNTPSEFRKFFPERDRLIASNVGTWYEHFIMENYTTQPLFTSAIPTIKRFIVEGYETYLPKAATSMKAAFHGFKGHVKEFGETEVKPGQWRSLERFEGVELPNEHVMFAGGPVKDMVWISLEPHSPSPAQYLALAVRKAPDRFVRFAQPKLSRSLIYILKYEVSDALERISGSIHYAIAIDNGPVHRMEFIPSGGYAPDINRLSLLAVGTVETEVKVYALPLEVEKRDCDAFPIVHLEPAFILCLELEGNRVDHTDAYESQCMCLVWSQTRGHTYVVGGYLNGYVAIWDVTDEEDNLNRFVLGDVKQFVPVSFFWTMENRINNIAVHYDMNGLRWLVVCNSTRQILFYDLREINNPVLMHSDVLKNVCNSLDWPVVWENPSFGVGDCMPSQGSCVNTMSPMCLMYASRRLDRFCCGVNDINFNAWRNLYVAGAENGDIHIIPLKQAILDVSTRTKSDKKMIMSLDIVSLNGEPVSLKVPDKWRLYDKDSEEDYGLVFGIPHRIWGSKQPEFYSAKRIPPLNLACFMRVNRVRFNPNRSADSLLAIGYDNGFLRIVHQDWY